MEQFIPKTTPATNPVISLIVQRINTTKTLSENIVFIFNRAGESYGLDSRALSSTYAFGLCAEDRSVQMLVLKFLYLIFTIPSTFEWFYTNDLNIVLDVIIRELAATGAEEAAVRHLDRCPLRPTADEIIAKQLQQGYLRILTPLLLNTRLVSSASFSKLPEIRRLLDSLSAAPEGTIDPTVRRLAQRTAGECEHIWCTAR